MKNSDRPCEITSDQCGDGGAFSKVANFGKAPDGSDWCKCGVVPFDHMHSVVCKPRPVLPAVARYEPEFVLVDPASLYIVHIHDGEEVVRGGDDGQAWVATFCGYQAAHMFVEMCKSAGLSPSGLLPNNQESVT